MADDVPGYFVGRPTSTAPGLALASPSEYYDVRAPAELLEYMDINIKWSPGILEAQAERIIDAAVSGMRERSIIQPILGLGGIGKTTLAQMVLSHTEFQGDHHLWINVSADFGSCLNEIRSLIEDILPQQDQHISNDEEGIRDLLRNLVAGGQERVVIVLDELCETDDSMLEDLKCALDVGRNLFVLVTTRSVNIARKIGTMEPHKLDADMCWQIAKLPEASPADATTLCVLHSLKQSYSRMEADLKACFEYCAIFPDGHDIVKDDLIQQWIALDLIKPDEESTSQQVGERNIMKLLDIFFLEPAKSVLGEKGVLFTMRDVVRALAKAVAKDKVIVWDGKSSANPQNKNGCIYALVTNFDTTSTKFSSTLSDDIKALHFQGCGIKKGLKDESISFAKNLYVLQVSKLSTRRLPASICRLKQLMHLNLSGCGELEQLPKSFGDLTNMVYINLSRCYGVKKLPESFVGLKNLVHLDLSFCSCFQGMSIVLRGLTKLEHLNLSHPCCFPNEDNRAHLMELKGVWEKLTKLQYLNLSMFLNPIFRHMTEKEREAYMEKLDCLTNLEHLDLSHNIFLFHLPKSFGELTNLLKLDLSGCIRLKSIDPWVNQEKSLKVVELRDCRALEYEFVVHADDGANISSIVRLEDVSPRVLEISCLENVKSMEEAKRIKLVEKRNLMKLALGWTPENGPSAQDQALLAELVPPRDLQFFKLHGYLGTLFPAWLTTGICYHLPNLVEVIMEAVPWWSSLQPFGLLPNLERLTLKKMASITRIDLRDQSGGNGAAFRRLSEVTLDDLENLDAFVGDDQRTFYALVIQKCPKLRCDPCPPRSKMLLVSDCRQLISPSASGQKEKRVGGRGPEGQDPSSSTSTASTQVTTELVIEVPLDELNWKKLRKLPSPDCLHIKNCENRTISQDIMPDIKEVIGPIKSLRFSECDSMTSLPEYLDGIISQISDELVIYRCRGIKSLPQSIIQKLTKVRSLYIMECPELRSWCEAEENKKKLTSINITYGSDTIADDGFSWRKYGQKDIFGARFPRSYYRCTYRNQEGCKATKQVQRSDNELCVVDVKYVGVHTCQAATQCSQTAYPPIGHPAPQDPSLELLSNFSKLETTEAPIDASSHDQDDGGADSTPFSFPTMP